MRIESNIEYWSDEFLTFDPEKIINKLSDYFSQIEIDSTDYSLAELEKFIDYANKNIDEPNRSKMIDSMQRKNWTNGPVFRFQINIDKVTKISGYAKRYTIAFFSKIPIDVEIEKIIIEFLKALKYGEIKSDVQTKYFCKPHENNKDFWFLEESI